MQPFDATADSSAALDGQPPDAERHGPGHIVPAEVLLAVFAALMALTVVTVAVTAVDLGSWNLPIALAIATFKAALVALYFMHLRYDSPLYGLIFVAALVFVTLFIALTLLDSVPGPGELPYPQDAIATTP